MKAFADRLWGDIYFDKESRKFTRKQSDPEQNRTFVHFILEPLYKLYTQVLSEETDSLRETLRSLGIQLKPVMYKMDVRPLLKAVLDQLCSMRLLTTQDLVCTASGRVRRCTVFKVHDSSEGPGGKV